VPTITLTPNPMPYDPKNGNIPASVWRESRGPPPPRADLTILESEMPLRTLVPGGPYHSVCAAEPQSCMKEFPHSTEHTHTRWCVVYRNVTQHASLAGLPASPPRAGSESRPHVQTLDWNTVP